MEPKSLPLYNFICSLPLSLWLNLPFFLLAAFDLHLSNLLFVSFLYKTAIIERLAGKNVVGITGAKELANTRSGDPAALIYLNNVEMALNSN